MSMTALAEVQRSQFSELILLHQSENDKLSYTV